MRSHHISLCITLALVLLASSTHAQQQRELNDQRTGKSTGRTVTDSNGTTTVYDEHGRVIRRSTTDSDGAGHVYAPDGRKMLTITPKQEPGILMETTWDAKGDVDRDSFLVEVVDGKQKVVQILPKLGK